MNISKSSGLSATYENGKLVDKKGFIINSNGEYISLQIFNDDQSISGKIDEEDLMKILENMNTQNDTSVFNKLTEDFPTKSESKKKKKKCKPTKKIKK